MIVFRHCVTAFGNVVLECEGHAGYAGKGQDIVCAGVSALCMAAEAALESYDKRCVKNASDGYFCIRCKYTPETAAVARTVICGMECIAQLYPEHVSCQHITAESTHRKKS